MKVGIVGSGNIGGTLTRRLRQLGHEVAVSNSRGPDSLGELADETGARPATVEDAVREAELVIVAVPLRAVRELPAEAFEGKVVVDADNYYPGRDGQIPEIEEGEPSSRWVAEQLHGATVVKAFNNIMAAHLMENGLPSGEEGRIALPVASDDPAAKQTVMGLVDALGFDPVDGGSLDDSWRQEPGTPVYTSDGDLQEVKQRLAAASR
jgi:8-hydroxy-5-deazaflavin:NADPH oxidoreductase